MTARSGRVVPALGLTAAAILLAAVGVCAMSFADESSTPSSSALAVLSSSSPASTLAARAVPKPTASPAVSASGTGSKFATAVPSSTAPKLLAVPPTGVSASEQAVFEAINQARIAQHLPTLKWSPQLQLSAQRHNQAMAADNTLTHQVGNEGSLGQRENAAGIRWSFAAENIGWTTTGSLDGALGIQSSMLAESAPDDAHRRNILSKDARAVGIAVLVDIEHDRLWLTEDFADVG